MLGLGLSISRISSIITDSIIRSGLVMFNKFTTAGISHPAQGSAEFDGSSDYIQLDTPFSYTNHTIAAWVYAKAVSSTIFDNRDADDDGIRFVVAVNGSLYYQLNSSDRTNAMSLNEWHYVVASYDGTTQKLYVDGSLVSSGARSQTISTTTNAKIGESTYESVLMDGNLANVAIWNRALSSDEINSVMWKSYDSLETSEKSGLQAWYSLDDISGTSVPDSSGNGNDGTAN